MNRLSTLILIGLVGLMASCGSSINSTTQPGVKDIYTMVVTPIQFTLNSGDWSTITATVYLSNNNSASRPVAPQPPIKFYSSDPRISISPAGSVCAGQWDSRYLICTPSVIPPCTTVVDSKTGVGTCVPNANAGQPDLPAGFVTLTAYAASRAVSATTLVSIHSRAGSISLNANSVSTDPGVWTGSTQPWPSDISGAPLSCISQTGQVKYVAQSIDANGNPVHSCSVLPATPGCINDNDYTWTSDNPNVASISNYGFVAALSPGVTNIFAKLNGTVSAPLAFVTCPPASIILTTSPFTNGIPVPPYSTGDLDALNKGSTLYVNATLLDTYGKSLITAPLNYLTTDPLTASLSPDLALTSKLAANTSGRFNLLASCEPAACNPAVQNFVSPAGAGTSLGTGFGYPIYSNVIGATVQGQTGSAVLVTGTTLADGVTPAHHLLVYDSESLSITNTVELPNLPNSLVVAPNGSVAYLGSDATSTSAGGLMVVDLTSLQATVMSYPVVGGLSTDVVTGTVLGVSPDDRYVLVSDTSDPDPANNLVFLIDTTGTKVATRYTNLGPINSVTFAADDSNFWIGGTTSVNCPVGSVTCPPAGVYAYQADTFVPISSQTPTDAGRSTNVKALAWMPDGQSFFASGDQLIDYSTCNAQNPQSPSPNLSTTVLGSMGGLSTTALNGVPQLLGLSGTNWFDYAVTTSAQVGNQSVQSLTGLKPNGTGNVCKSTVAVALSSKTPVHSTLACPAEQITFSPTLEQAFVTGVVTKTPATPTSPTCATPDVIHGYDVVNQTEILLNNAKNPPVIPLSGGVLNDGRKLYFGTWDSTAKTATLHRIDLSTGTGTPGTLLEDLDASVDLVPSFVAVVPK